MGARAGFRPPFSGFYNLFDQDGHLAERREDPLYRGEKVAQCDVIFLTPPVLWSERVSAKRLNEAWLPMTNSKNNVSWL